MLDREELTRIQQRLLEHGLDLGRSGVDGRLGPHTANAMKAYLKDQDLPASPNPQRNALAILKRLGAYHPQVAHAAPARPAAHEAVAGAHPEMTADELNAMQLNKLHASQPQQTAAATPSGHAAPATGASAGVARSQADSSHTAAAVPHASHDDESPTVQRYRQALVQSARDSLGKTNANGEYAPRGVAWCAGFADHLRQEAAAHVGFSGQLLPGDTAKPDNMSAFGTMQHAQAQGAFHPVDHGDTHGYTPKPGDTAVFLGRRGSPALGHVAMVESFDANTGTIHVIEGNSTRARGGAVSRGTYSLNDSRLRGVVDEGHVLSHAMGEREAQTRQAGRDLLASAGPATDFQGHPPTPPARPGEGGRAIS